MDIQKMIKDYADWMYKGFSTVKIGEYYELTTPYLDRYNDHLQIYVKQNQNGSFSLSDDGYVISNLISSGVSISRSAKRKEMLNKITRNFGVSVKDENLEIQATQSDYPQKKHMLIQAMLTVDDMFIAEPNAVKNFFAEDVGLFLDTNNVYYSKDFSLVGKTGSLYVYDYHLQRTKEKPERFCKAINRMSESTRNLTLFNWVDTIEKRTEKSDLLLFLNDEKDIDGADLDALRSYDVNYVLWSERNKPENIAFLAS